MERLADLLCRRQRVGHTPGPFWVDVDQAHLTGAERLIQIPAGRTVTGAVALVTEPGVLRSPVDFFRLPDILAPEAEPERFEAHRFEGAVTGKDQQVSPGDLAAVLLLDRPQQTARLVQADVVGPAVKRGEALRAPAGPAAAIGDAVSTRGMPGHPDEQRPVVPVVSRPPVLRGRHHREEVPLQCLDVERPELLRVAEIFTQRA